MTLFADKGERILSNQSLFNLVAFIARDRDVDALMEILSYRKSFCFEGRRNLVLPDYLSAMWRNRLERRSKEPTQLWDRARDLTLDKFTALPGITGAQTRARDPGDENGPGSRVDCRIYYAALLKNLEADKEFRTASGSLEQDHVVAVKFQKFVNHHFYFSYLEARRQMNPFISRYSWRVDGRGTITVWMPKYLKGRERRVWLEKHMDNPDPKRSGERARIQGIIDEVLAIPGFVPLDTQREVSLSSGFPPPDVEADRKMRPSFVAFLAREKAVSADLQRPTIRRLGFENIERLVNIVVPNLVTRERTDEDISREFGLSKTAQSHFCGSDWYKDEKTGKTVIPDLWRNAAELLSQMDAFRDIAMEAGVFKAAVTIVNQDGPARLRTNRHVQ